MYLDLGRMAQSVSCGRRMMFQLVEQSKQMTLDIPKLNLDSEVWWEEVRKKVELAEEFLLDGLP